MKSESTHYDPAIVLIVIQPVKTCAQDTCARMFITALYEIALNWK